MSGHPLDEAMSLHGCDPNEDLSLRGKDRCSMCGVPLHGEGIIVVRRKRFKTKYCPNCHRLASGFLGRYE